MSEPILPSVAINIVSGFAQQGMALAGLHGYRNVIDVIQRGKPSENADALRATHVAYVRTMRVMARAARDIAADPESRRAARELEALTDRPAFSAFRWDGEHFPLAETHAAIDAMFAGHDGLCQEDLLRRYDEVVIRDLEVWGVILSPPLRHLFVYGWGKHLPWHANFHTEFGEEVKTNTRAFRILTFEALTELRQNGVELRQDLAQLFEQGKSILEQGGRMEGKIDRTLDIVSTIADRFAGASQPGAPEPEFELDRGEPSPKFARTAINPYRDLAYFDVADARQFCGREEEARRAFAHLAEVLDDGARPAGLVISGQTGSGKSSFLRAGVLAGLGEIVDRRYHVAIVRPDHFATDESLAAQLLGMVAEQTDLLIPGEDIARCLRLTNASIARHIRDVLTRAVAGCGGQFIFAVDQFEEIVDFWADRGEGYAAERAFWSPLFDFIEEFDGKQLGCVIYTLESNRKEIIANARTSAIFDLSSVNQIDLNNGSNSLFRQVIRKPFLDAGYHLSPVLVQRLLRQIELFNRTDVPGHPAVMPLLSLRLSRLFEHVERNFSPVARASLNSEDPEAAGSGYVRAADFATDDQFLDTLGGEVSLLAEAAFTRGTGNVDPTDEDLNILMPFVELTGSSTDLIRLTSVPRSSLKFHTQLIRHLRDSRLVVERRGYYRLIHEAVIRNWPPAKAWLERNATVLSEAASLRLRAQMWKIEGRPEIVGVDEKILQAAGNILAIQRSFWDRNQDDLEPGELLLKDYCIAIAHHLADPRQQFDGLPAVGLVALYGLDEVLERLLDIDPAAIESRSSSKGSTPLIYAGWHNAGTVALLIARGADLNAQDKDGWSVLSSAIWGRNERGFEHILSALGDSLPTSPYGTVLHECAAAGTTYMAQRLLAAGYFDATEKNANGWLPIHFAAHQGNLELFRLLREQSDPFAETGSGYQPIHLAAATGHLAIVDAILDIPEAQQHVGAPDHAGWNCLHHAASNQQAQVVRRLAEVLDVNALTGGQHNKGSTALILAVMRNGFDRKASESAILRTVEALLAAPTTDPNLANASRRTALSLSEDLPRVERALLADHRLDLFGGNYQTDKHPIELVGNRGHMVILRAMLERAAQSAPPDWSPFSYLVNIKKIDTSILEKAVARWPVSTELARRELTRGRSRNPKMLELLLSKVDRLKSEAALGLWLLIADGADVALIESFASKMERPWSTPYFGSWTFLHRLCAAQAESRIEELKPLFEQDESAWKLQDGRGHNPASLLRSEIRERLLPGTSGPPTPVLAASWDACCTWVPMTAAELAQFERQDPGVDIGPESCIEVTRLPFYPDSVRLVCVRDPGFRPPGANVFWLALEGRLFRLSGASLPIHQLNELGPLNLGAAGNDVVADYLRFFGFFVRGEDGPFLTLESIDQPGFPEGLTDEEARLLSSLFTAPVIDDGDNGSFRVLATMLYGNAAFGCDLVIAASGMVEMLRDFPLTPDLSAAPDWPIELVD